MTTIAAPGQSLTLNNPYGSTNAITLAAGETYLIPPGDQVITPGLYTFFQVLDPITGMWRNTQQTPNISQVMQSDGVNYRLANLTGCLVGVAVNNGGTGYSTGVTVTATSGSPTIKAIVGGMVGSTGTFVTVGTGYTYNPIVVVTPPPAGGVPCTASVTISNSTGSTLTITNQGAGYVTAPTFNVIPDIRDTTGQGMTISATITNATSITCIVTNHGTPLSTVPTIATSNSGAGTGFTATAIMCFAVTAATVTAAGTGFSTSANYARGAGGWVVTGTTAFTNPAIERGIFNPRDCLIMLAAGTSLSGTIINTVDAGLFQAAPVLAPLAAGGTPTGGTLGVTFGSVTDISYITPA